MGVVAWAEPDGRCSCEGASTEERSVCRRGPDEGVGLFTAHARRFAESGKGWWALEVGGGRVVPTLVRCIVASFVGVVVGLLLHVGRSVHAYSSQVG